MLIVNAAAAYQSSRGVMRYFDTVLKYLELPYEITMTPTRSSRYLAKLIELVALGEAGAVLWSPSHRGPLFARNHVVTVHDCINVEYVYRRGWQSALIRALNQKMFDNAKSVVAISNSTRDALLRNYVIDPGVISVIPSSCHVELGEWQPRLSGFKSSMPYVLMVTNSLEHKNAVRACIALRDSGIVKRGLGLRVVGSLPPEAINICQHSGIDLKIFSMIDDRELQDMYRGCRFFLSASLEEGHNLTIAEGLACGARVLCSDIAAHREFYAGYVEFFDPRDTDSMIWALEQEYGRDFFPSAPVRWKRTFADVASEYRNVFDSIL